MAFPTFKSLPALLLGAACLAGTPAGAADTPPDKPTGLSGATDAIGLVELSPHNLPGAIGDYDLRARSIVVAPGGGIPDHSHAGRPGIARVTRGTLIEYRGNTQRTLQVGDVWFENADTMHWFRNPSSTEAAELWVVDVVPRKK